MGNLGSCKGDPNAATLLNYGTKESLMIGTDYSHADQSAEIQALNVIKQRAEKGEIPAAVARKNLDDNLRRFYGL
jgi:hypothetical protein